MDNFQTFLENRQIGRKKIAASVKTFSPIYEEPPAFHAQLAAGAKSAGKFVIIPQTIQRVNLT